MLVARERNVGGKVTGDKGPAKVFPGVHSRERCRDWPRRVFRALEIWIVSVTNGSPVVPGLQIPARCAPVKRTRFVSEEKANSPPVVTGDPIAGNATGSR